MKYNILIPKRKAFKDVRTGGGEYWQRFWNGFDNSELYTKRVSSLKESSLGLTKLPLNDDSKVYAEVTLIDEVQSKSDRPSIIWDETSLDIVASTDNQTYKISGRKADFAKLNKVLADCSYPVAKEGGSRKNQKISREVYAIASIENATNTIGNRLDQKLSELVNQNFDEAIDCIIEITQDCYLSQYDNIYDKLSKKIAKDKLKKWNTDFFVYNLLYGATLNVEEIKDILGDVEFGFIHKIKISPLYKIQRSINGINLSNVKYGKPETNQVVAVIDSGIDQTFIGNFIKIAYNSLQSNNSPDKNHGTFVASRILFGESIVSDIQKQRNLSPVGVIIDSQIAFGTSAKTEPYAITEAIEKVAKRHKEVFVYNLSICDVDNIDITDISDLTAKIDDIAKKYDILVVCSAGNHRSFTGINYESIFEDSNQLSLIASPADALNVLSVGSIADKANGDCICCHSGYPSPFTRRGDCRGGMKKPELVASGGNIKADPSGNYQPDFFKSSNNVFGVDGINASGLAKDTGTSFSAPLISRQAVLLYDYIINTNISNLLDLKDNRVNLVKALLIHSTSMRDQVEIENDGVKKAYGFGVPDWTEPLEDESEDKVTIMYCDALDYSNKKHKLNIELPTNLVGKKLSFILTLVYNPPTNKNFPNNYNMIDVSASMRLLRPTVNEKGEAGFEPDYITPKSQDWNWDNYKRKVFNVIHYKGTKRSLSSSLLEISLNMNSYPEFDKKNLDKLNQIKQPYAFVLTIIDEEKTNRIRESIIATNKFEVLNEVRESVEVRT